MALKLHSGFGVTPIVDAHGQVATNQTGDTVDDYGMKIHTNKACILKSVAKYSTATGTHCRLRNTSNTILATGVFSGDNAPFSYALANNTDYYLTVDADGGLGKMAYNNVASCPYNLTNINFIRNWDKGSEGGTTAIYNIVSVTTQ